MGVGQSKERRSVSYAATSAPVESQTMTVDNEHDGYAIPIKVWSSTSKSSPSAVVLFLHGGMFSKNDYNSHPAVLKGLVQSLNMVVVTANFRDGSTTTHSTGETMNDLHSLAAFCRNDLMASFSNNSGPRIPFGIIGSSSGGYFALELTRLLVSSKRDVSDGGNNHNNDSADFCIALCPVSNPQARALYLQHCIDHSTPLPNGKDLYGGIRHTPDRAREILKNQLQYWQSYKDMAIAGQNLSNGYDNDDSNNACSVPTLLVLGSQDKNVPLNATHNVQQWATKTIIIGGAGHELQSQPPAKNSYIPDMDTFLQENVAAWNVTRDVEGADDDDGMLQHCRWPFKRS